MTKLIPGVAYGFSREVKNRFAGLRRSSLLFTCTSIGATGNDVTMEYANTVTAGNEVADISGPSVTVSIQSGVSTAQQVFDAIQANALVTDTVSVQMVGSPSAAQTTLALTNFTGGYD